MAFSIYEVIRVTCQSRSWFVYIPREIERKQTNYPTDKPRKRLRKMLKAMPEKNPWSQGKWQLDIYKGAK